MQFCNILLFAEAKVEKSIKCMDLSVFICTFAMLYQSEACFLIAALRQVKLSGMAKPLATLCCLGH